MKVTAISIVIGVLARAIKWLAKRLEDLEIRGRDETIQTTALLRSKYWVESWRLAETCYPLLSRGKPSANAGVKTSQMSKINLLENWKSMWNMRVTIVPIVIGAFGTVN